jgi:glutaredoxin
MKQECKLSSIRVIWVAVLGVVLALGTARGWPAAVLAVIVGVLFQVGYVRTFPHVSQWLGFGSVDDVRPAHHARSAAAIPRVTLYTAAGCPFCPLVRQRLHQLQQELWFALDEHDVTFPSATLRGRGIRSVPAVEVDGRFLVGNATSYALVAFLTGGRLKAAS